MSGCLKIADLESLFKFFSYRVVERMERCIQPELGDLTVGFVRVNVLKEAGLQQTDLLVALG